MGSTITAYLSNSLNLETKILFFNTISPFRKNAKETIETLEYGESCRKFELLDRIRNVSTSQNRNRLSITKNLISELQSNLEMESKKGITQNKKISPESKDVSKPAKQHTSRALMAKSEVIIGSKSIANPKQKSKPGKTINIKKK